MALSWSLDKVGPMCRSVEDCALVLDAIQGPDERDLSVQNVPFNWDPSLDVRRLRIGYLKAAFNDTKQTPHTDANDAAALEQLRSLGLSLRSSSPCLNTHLPTRYNRALRRSECGARGSGPRATGGTRPPGPRCAPELRGCSTASDYLDVNRLARC